MDVETDVNAVANNGSNAAGFAFRGLRGDPNQMADVLRVLVDAGIEINHQNPNNGATVLHAIAWAGNEEGIRIYLENGADPNLRNLDGDTSLHAACTGWEKSAVRALVLAGADPEFKNVAGQRPIDAAPMLARSEIQEVIDEALARRAARTDE